MNVKIKVIIPCLLLLLMAFLVGCEQSPYEINDSENYTVSIKFDANGGAFTDNAPVIMDSYNITELPTNAAGNAQIALIEPSDSNRGKDAFMPVKNGYFLAGWYQQCEETTDSQGNVTYTYGQPWNFATDRVEVDPNGAYTSQEPVLTLYAAWVPMYEIEFYDLASGQLLETYSFSPLEVEEILLPQWNEETGAINMYKFPKKEGYTFCNAYYDAAGTQTITENALVHPAVLNPENATVENPVLQLYVDWTEGEWYRIYTAEQFADNFSPNGSYEICADLDFTDEVWPTAAMYGNFSGTINGNGHTISNVVLTQTDNSKTNAGLFGQLGETAALNDVTFQNVTFTIRNGTRMAGTAYGLLCGSLSDSAALTNVNILESTLQISSSCYFGTDDYVIGLLCGMGEPALDYSGITCQATGDQPENVVITVTENTVSVEFVTP